ncbi:hypothetical protein SELMODRAFT_413736 [Selaginella moellendorffii]|uniref:Uncharacterized protein n=1 Tax=Selaginella moellendorffii TaxID=88036 RepID=D8RQ21_SELML|nr:hypothetical protein SELMODRAFT_413736 [Selaginella moellendorffii]
MNFLLSKLEQLNHHLMVLLSILNPTENAWIKEVYKSRIQVQKEVAELRKKRKIVNIIVGLRTIKIAITFIITLGKLPSYTSKNSIHLSPSLSASTDLECDAKHHIGKILTNTFMFFNLSMSKPPGMAIFHVQIAEATTFIISVRGSLVPGFLLVGTEPACGLGCMAAKLDWLSD